MKELVAKADTDGNGRAGKQENLDALAADLVPEGWLGFFGRQLARLAAQAAGILSIDAPAGTLGLGQTLLLHRCWHRRPSTSTTDSMLGFRSCICAGANSTRARRCMGAAHLDREAFEALRQCHERPVEAAVWVRSGKVAFPHHDCSPCRGSSRNTWGAFLAHLWVVFVLFFRTCTSVLLCSTSNKARE